jgi:hypothetical protein
MYILDYFVKVQEALTPDKRQPKQVAFQKGLVSDIDNLHTQLFSTYKNHQTLPTWSVGTYNRKDLVRYGKSIFQSNIDNNSIEPTFDNNWSLVSNNFLGNDFRIAIRGERLVLEYALNVWFDTVFRQPPFVSDIFITTNTAVGIDPFRVGSSEIESSNAYSDNSSELIINAYSFATQFNMDINVPSSFFNSLGTTNNIRESIIKSFADKYIPAGLTYKITIY